jgi:uncharacterized protein
MTDLAVALGLVLVLEGAAYALFPAQMRRLMEQMRTLAENQLRTAGLVAALVGLMIVWLARTST